MMYKFIAKHLGHIPVFFFVTFLLAFGPNENLEDENIPFVVDDVEIVL